MDPSNRPQTPGLTGTPHFQPKYGAYMGELGRARARPPGPHWPASTAHIFVPIRSPDQTLEPLHSTPLHSHLPPKITSGDLRPSPTWRATDLSPSPPDPSTMSSSHAAPRRRWQSGFRSATPGRRLHDG